MEQQQPEYTFEIGAHFIVTNPDTGANLYFTVTGITVSMYRDKPEVMIEMERLSVGPMSGEVQTYGFRRTAQAWAEQLAKVNAVELHPGDTGIAHSRQSLTFSEGTEWTR
ncbi:MAG: hypothetical protein JW892_17515 [Anaerolineae bacterium]|nr:hypothetical protein [Anaerolineae bacterium]